MLGWQQRTSSPFLSNESESECENLQMACEELIYVNYEHDTDAVSVGSLSTAVSLCAAVSAGMREMSNS